MNHATTAMITTMINTYLTFHASFVAIVSKSTNLTITS